MRLETSKKIIANKTFSLTFVNSCTNLTLAEKVQSFNLLISDRITTDKQLIQRQCAHERQYINANESHGQKDYPKKKGRKKESPAVSGAKVSFLWLLPFK